MAEQQNGSKQQVFYTPDGRSVEIRDVWSETLEAEMVNLRELVVNKPNAYNHIAMVRIELCKPI
jgi:hypothetical protein